jgi:hypothetical protein
VTRSQRVSQLFENIVRLHRAERALPGNEDVLAVRTWLEGQLGSTVTRSQAAKLLGLSHTALQRWEKSGDLPLVVTPAGREEVPVGALVQLYEPAMAEGRRRADRLDATRLAEPEREAMLAAGSLDRHELAQLRSLAYHRAVAERLRRPAVNDARNLIWQWRNSGRIDPAYADRWDAILNRPVAEVRRFLRSDTPEARDLRQSSPFAGALSEPERRRILESIR